MSMTRRQFLGTAAAVGAGAYAVADTPANTQPGADYPVQGIDVSRWQGTIDWPKVAGAGIKFCFCKATEGTPDGTFEGSRSALDPMFATNWPAIKNVGIVRGAYHMVRPSMGTAKAQADYFLDTINPTKGDLRPALDMEMNDGLTAAQVWQFFQLMVSRIKSRIGRAPIVYTGFFYWRDRVGNPLSNLDCPLWFARWSHPIPPNEFPRSWTSWTFWQYASQADPPVPGISGDLDRNAFTGSLAGLNKYRLP